jgi:hypothetical protein
MTAINFTDVQTVQCKGKDHARTGHEGPDGEKTYNYSSLASALDEVDGKHHPSSGLFTLGRGLHSSYPRFGLDRCAKSRPRWDSIP